MWFQGPRIRQPILCYFPPKAFHCWTSSTIQLDSTLLYLTLLSLTVLQYGSNERKTLNMYLSVWPVNNVSITCQEINAKRNLLAQCRPYISLSQRPAPFSKNFLVGKVAFHAFMTSSLVNTVNEKHTNTHKTFWWTIEDVNYIGINLFRSWISIKTKAEQCLVQSISTTNLCASVIIDLQWWDSLLICTDGNSDHFGCNVLLINNRFYTRIERIWTQFSQWLRRFRISVSLIQRWCEQKACGWEKFF